MIKIVDKKVAGVDWNNKPNFWEVTFENEKGEQWHAHMGKDALRRRELKNQFEEAGYDMKAIAEYYECAWRDGQESMMVN